MKSLYNLIILNTPLMCTRKIPNASPELEGGSIGEISSSNKRKKESTSKMAKLINCSKRPKQVPNEREIIKSMGYTLGKSIGEGTYSKVYVAMAHLDNSLERVACKIIQKKLAGSEFIKKFLPRELSIIRHLEHDHIVSVHNVIELPESIYIIMDYCRNGDLLEYVRNHGPLEESLSKSYFRQIVNAVGYLHALDIAHRDLKCENIFLESSHHVKLGDFGFARFCVDDKGAAVKSSTFCGSAAYAAPEIIQGIPYDPKMYDIWALGCILYIMISATMPYDDTNIKKMLKNQLNRALCVSVYKPWKGHCLHLRNLIAYLLEPDVSKRATIRQVGNCIWLHLKPSESDNTQITGDKHYFDEAPTDCHQMSKSSIF